jgi:hypothetical protein
LRGVAKENGAEAQSAADRFLYDPHALDGGVAFFSPLGMRKGVTQLLNQRIVVALNAAQAVLNHAYGFGRSRHAVKDIVATAGWR